MASNKLTEGLSGTSIDNTMEVQPVVSQSVCEKMHKSFSPLIIIAVWGNVLGWNSHAHLCNNTNLFVKCANFLQVTSCGSDFV